MPVIAPLVRPGHGAACSSHLLPPLIKGLPIANIEERISLYADDTLVYLADTNESLRALLEEVTTFGDYSGFRVNWDKSSLFPLDVITPLQIHPDSKLQVVSSFRYLGVLV